MLQEMPGTASLFPHNIRPGIHHPTIAARKCPSRECSGHRKFVEPMGIYKRVQLEKRVKYVAGCDSSLPNPQQMWRLWVYLYLNVVRHQSKQPSVVQHCPLKFFPTPWFNHAVWAPGSSRTYFWVIFRGGPLSCLGDIWDLIDSGSFNPIKVPKEKRVSHTPGRNFNAKNAKDEGYRISFDVARDPLVREPLLPASHSGITGTRAHPASLQHHG